MGSARSLLLLARRARRLLDGAAAVPQHRSVRRVERGERATSALLRRLQAAVPSVSPGAFEPAVRAHRAAERLGGDLARRRGHGGGEEEEQQEEVEAEKEEGGGDGNVEGDATVGSVPRPPLRRGVIRQWWGGVRGGLGG